MIMSTVSGGASGAGGHSANGLDGSMMNDPLHQPATMHCRAGHWSRPCALH